MSKYKASKCEYNGIKFDSKKERDRYIFLKGMEDNGKISNLELQKAFVLIPVQREKSTINSKGKEVLGKVKERDCKYIADFCYECNGETIVEDVKGYRQGGAYSVFTIKRKLMLYLHGIEVHEV
jgi:hypothetical protein